MLSQLFLVLFAAFCCNSSSWAFYATGTSKIKSIHYAFLHSRSRKGTELSLTSLLSPQTTSRSASSSSSAAATVISSSPGVIPFVITRVEKDGLQDMQDVSEMCVDVFFNEENSDNILKAMQLAYLRNLQYGDLRMKFFTMENSSGSSDLFVARQVLPAAAAATKKAREVPVTEKVYNAKYLDSTTDGYVMGDVLGFVEVAEKRFRLGEQYESESEMGPDYRPFLSNLSVREDARQSGVGSALVESCEYAVRSWPRTYKEIVLQVEDNNKLARKFYEKRGYVALFADPACRRFDTTGWVLRKVPTTKVAMRKILSGSSRSSLPSSGASAAFSLDGLFNNLRQLVGN